jgi:hypothetical protein
VRDLWFESLETDELNFISARGYFVDKYPDMFAEIQKKQKKYQILLGES